MKNMIAQVELKSVDMKMSNGRDFLSCLAEMAPAEAYPMENDVLQVSRWNATGGSLQQNIKSIRRI